MKPLLEDFFLFDSVLLDLYPACAEDCTLINIINKCCTPFVSFCMDFGIAETGDCTWYPS
jgi:hypothetical protein